MINLQVNTYDQNGGAEKISWDLFEGYSSRGHDSWLVVGDKRTQDPKVVEIPALSPRENYISKWLWNRTSKRQNQACENWIKHKINRICFILADLPGEIRRRQGHEDFNFPGSKMLLDCLPNWPDIIHFHNLHGDYFDLRTLPYFSQKVPAVITLHDAWLLSGHCAHSFNCERWKTGCGNCPDLTLYPAVRRDATRYNWNRKASIYRKSHLYVVTPCRWLMDKVDRSMLSPASIIKKVIPNGIRTDLFHPADKMASKKKLKIDQNSLVILFIANGGRQNRYKDFATFDAVVTALRQSNTGKKIIINVLGMESSPEIDQNLEVKYCGYQKDPSTVACYYQSSDVYIHPANAETFPLTILEAMSCGVPVVASNVGGISEQITDGKTGYLVQPGNSLELTDKLELLLMNDELRDRMSENCREEVLKRFSLTFMIDQYLTFYQESIDDWRYRRAYPV
jgi:glycosyltransferase involved in cell wall biosynthesis